MTNDHLATYLRDHLAGSVGAIELIERMIEVYKGQPIAEFCQGVRDRIVADQEKLRAVMKAVEVEESSLRKASAWVAEKLSRPKLSPAGDEADDIGLVQALEGLVLGIKGKEALWRALGEVQASWPPWEHFDFQSLEKSALEQGARVDEKRVQAARKVLRGQGEFAKS